MISFRRAFVLSCVAVAFVANVECDPTPADASASGSVGGTSVPTTTVISMIVSPTSGANPRWNLVFSSASFGCSDYDTTQSGGIAIADETALSISGDATDQTTVTPTNFSIGGDAAANGNLQAAFTVRGDDCSLTSTTGATSGSVTFTTYSTSEVAGSFSLSFAGSDHLSGTFDVTPCDPQSFDPVAPGAAPQAADCAQSQ